jgi:hypothetical protein
MTPRSPARLAALAALALGACGTLVTTPVDDARGPHDRPGATEGPWARCQFETSSPQPEDMPTVCPDANASHEGPWTCNGGTESRTFKGTPYVYCEAFAACIYDCTTAADCPAPGSGTATMACFAGTCQLGCAADAECPQGMTCIGAAQGLGPGRCLWMYADYCDNGPTSPADPCAGKATCEPCEICDGCDADAFCNADGDCQYGDPGACVSG